MPLDVGIANIKNFPDMPRQFVVEDGLKMAAHADIWMQQENNPREDDNAIAAALGKEWGHVGGKTNLPIWFKKDRLRPVGDLKIIHMPWVNGELTLVPKPRIHVIQKFELLDRPGLPHLTFMNNHLIAGGMNGPRTERRKVQWQGEWRVTSGSFQQEAADGDTVVFGGDLNNPTPPKPARKFKYVAGRRLDRIGVNTLGPMRGLGGSVKVDVLGEHTIHLHSDHDGHIVRFNLSPRKR